MFESQGNICLEECKYYFYKGLEHQEAEDQNQLLVGKAGFALDDTVQKHNYLFFLPTEKREKT